MIGRIGLPFALFAPWRELFTPVAAQMAWVTTLETGAGCLFSCLVVNEVGGDSQ